MAKRPRPPTRKKKSAPKPAAAPKPARVKKPKAPKAKATRKQKVTTARIRKLVERYVKKPFTAEQSKDVTFHFLEGLRVTETLASLKVRRKELKDQIAAESAERAATISHENEQGRGHAKPPEGEPDKRTEPFSLDASRKISGHELDIKRFTLQLADVEKEVRDTTAQLRTEQRSLRNVIDNAWEGPTLFDKSDTVDAADKTGPNASTEPNDDGNKEADEE